jgi:hypothetical protein
VARYPTGQPVRLSTTVKDVTGTLVNATAITLTIKFANADGTSTATGGSPYTPVNDSTGLYHQDIAATDLTTLGHYQYAWTATGTGAGVSFGDFDVFDPFEPALLPLQDAYDALNIPPAQQTAANGAEIAQYVATIETMLERLTGGPIINRTVVERQEMTQMQSVITVRQRPLVSVTSIISVASGTAIDITGGLDLDVNAGTVRRQFTGWPFILPTFVALPIVSITYVAGWGTSAPAAFNTAARIILQNLWNTQHGPSIRPSMGSSDMTTMPGFGFAIPNQAAQLLEGAQNGLPFMLEAYV